MRRGEYVIDCFVYKSNTVSRFRLALQPRGSLEVLPEASRYRESDWPQGRQDDLGGHIIIVGGAAES